MLRHPAFVARNVRRDAQRKTFLAQQRVPAVSRAVGPDLASFGKVNDVFLLVTGPRHILLPGASGAPTLCMQGTTRLHVLIDLFENRIPMRAMMRMLTTT